MLTHEHPPVLCNASTSRSQKSTTSTLAFFPKSSNPPTIQPTNLVPPSPPSPTHTFPSLISSHPLSHPQTPLHPLPNRLLKLASPLPPHLGRLDIRRTLIIRLRQHAHHADQYLLHTLYRTPSLRCLLIVVRVVARGVQDGDADEAGGVDCVSKPTC